MIRFDRVAKRYPPGIDALSTLSFEMAAGEILVVSGHSGAGKSTLIKLIAAIEQPTSGAVLVGGRNVGGLARSALPFLRRRLGLVLQDQKLLFDRSVFENVMLPLAITGFPPKEATQRVRAALDKVGLAAREKALPIALSGGEQQRLAIARAVVSRPALLLADEPTAHLDAETATDVARIFHEFHRAGVTVLIATYDGQLFPEARTLRLDHGHLVP
ncbi:cell division protein FtsE [Rugosibacter aromaticivorans]|uniref:Cell division ATP-binding protein FtsE n=1 Tax=Rugosibacter aromaticivorans TaxID=1565605 RepID=A0A0C5IXU3_9PROT|nr:ATP-binding cassette domain-containing protein [Rugosibacter aromaticivorans]AJP47517.1 cell division protein FtsE [Rugosibacter aromaticivorans]TBR13002.1 MAG: ATP-binding cassette domain-containing protein [Rugosibacter sp.]